MKSAVVVFPGSNRERDMLYALELITGVKPHAIWHTERELPDVDLVVLPGGFSYGDYLRTGAIAARGNIMPAVARAADRGVRVLGDQFRGDAYVVGNHATASSTLSKSARPSVAPFSGSIMFSGCGIRPNTLPRSLRMPAMSLSEPLGLVPAA